MSNKYILMCFIVPKNIDYNTLSKTLDIIQIVSISSFEVIKQHKTIFQKKTSRELKRKLCDSLLLDE